MGNDEMMMGYSHKGLGICWSGPTIANGGPAVFNVPALSRYA